MTHTLPRRSSRVRHVTAAALAATLLAACESADMPPLESAQFLDRPRPVAEFELIDERGEAFSRSDLEGRWTVLFSGFTHCPDVCPVTLGLLNSAERRMDRPPAHRLVFLSVDPKRDTPEVLADYLGWFNPDWTGLTGPLAEVDRVLDSLDMARVRVPQAGGEYTVDHATAVVLVDPRARMVARWPAPLVMDRLAADLDTLAAL